MKTIINAVDFSECSMNAFRHALDYAKKTEARLVAIWVNPETFKFVGSTPELNDEDMWAREAFEGIWKQYKDELPPERLQYEVRRGQVYEELVKAVIEKDATMIVAGTHGVSGFKEFWMGSNVFRLIMSSPVPVLSISQKATPGRPVKNIVLPIDSTVETRQKNEMAAFLAKIFGAQIHVVSLYSSKIDDLRHLVDSYSKETIKYLREQNIAYQLVEREGGNITNITLDYAHEIQADLIVIMTEQEIKTSNLWMGPFAKQMVNHSDIPVLSIKPTELVQDIQQKRRI
jgi:nucleotide-binding universal stress UspA family protein